MLAAFDWRTFWDRIFRVDGAFFLGALRDDLHRGDRAGPRGRPRPHARADAHVAPARAAGPLGLLRLDLPRHAA